MEKKSNHIVLIVVILLIIGSLIGGIYIGKNLYKKGQDKCKEVPVTTSDLYDKDFDDEDFAYISLLVESSDDEILGYHSLEELPKGKIADMTKEDKKKIVYVGTSKFLLHGFYYDEESPDKYCLQGQGGCVTMTKDVYNKIAKKYNITDKFEDLYSDNHVVGDTVYMIPSGWVSGNKISHIGIGIKREGEYVILEDIVNIAPGDDPRNFKQFVIKYKFNKLNDGTYALYSIDY